MRYIYIYIFFFFPQDRMDLKIAVVDLYIMAATSSWLMTTMLQKVEVDDVSTYERLFFFFGENEAHEKVNLLVWIWKATESLKIAAMQDK